MSTPNHIIGLFPTPFMRVEKLLDERLMTALVSHYKAEANITNTNSSELVHTNIIEPGANMLLKEVNALVVPRLADFGELLFGERLVWSIKEMWVNLLNTGGQQTMHNHANCFISGVIYLTPSHESARTVFMKGLGGSQFVFSNAHADTTMTPFNADKWIAPDPTPGDLILFPSYLLHAVPVNLGALRISLAFNAIPTRLDSWGYAIEFNTQEKSS